MRLNSEELQRVVESIAVRKLKDGTWELDYKNADKFIKMVSPYVKTAAKKSDKYDPESAAQDILMHLWLALKRYGPNYQGKSFAQRMLPMKTNNVLTNNFKKRCSAKSKVNFLAESYDQLTHTNNEDEDHHEVIFPCSYPADFTSVAESIPANKREDVTKLIQTLKERDAMPQFLPVDDLFEYAKRLNNEDKRTLFFKIWALFSGMSPRGINKALAPIFNLAPINEKQPEEKKYNPDQEEPVQVLKQEPPSIQETKPIEPIKVEPLKVLEQVKTEETKEAKPRRIRLEFSEEEKPNNLIVKKTPKTDKIEDEEEYRKMLTNFKQDEYINIIDSTVGKQYLSPYGKKIQVIAKTGNRVRVLVLATEGEKDVPGDYRVIPLDTVLAKQVVTSTENNSNPSLYPPHSYPKVIKKEAKKEAKEVKEVIEEPNDLPVLKTKPEQPVVTKAAPKVQTAQLMAKGSGAMHTPKQKKGTAVDLVIQLLQQSPQTKVGLATAIIDNKLSKNTKIENVVNYVSVMLTKIKKKYNLKTSDGKYSIIAG
jgi:hypothetical protein